MSINDKLVEFQLDNGSTANILTRCYIANVQQERNQSPWYDQNDST